MYLPLSVELKSVLEEVNRIPETPMDNEFWNTPEMLDAESIDFDTMYEPHSDFTVNLSPDGKTCRQADRANDFDVVNVLVGPELFGRIKKLYEIEVRRRCNQHE